ncbi:hypothetical protein K4K56_010946 [Colletotrichum sp. SAR 10_98]|nr:hypothetical protein K4K56_010946 [Colletotrichum sp. SAR 10_98]
MASLGLGDIRAIISDVHTLITYLKGVYHAADERQELFRETNTLLVTLQETESLWSKYSTAKQHKVNAILPDVKECLLKIQGHLKRPPRFWKNIFTWIMWPRQKPDIELAIRKIRDHNKTLSELTILKIGEDVVEISEAARKQMIKDFVNELTPHISEELVKIPVRVNETTKGTGHWFRDVNEYKEWSKSSDGLLWVKGIQGCGKSGLANITSSELANEAKKSQAFRVASIYCDHQNARLKDADPMDIVMSFWAQLVASTPDTLFDKEFIETMRTKRTSGCSDHERKIEVFMHTAAKIGQLVLILDGLDEIPRDDERQAAVVKILKRIQRNTQQCRVLITSRPYKSITNLFQGDRQFQLEASEVDLELYMIDRLSRADWSTRYGDKVCRRIIKALTPKCKGLFLLSKLFMDDVLKAENEVQCFEIIEELPGSAKEAYNKGLKRLTQESPPPRTRKKEEIIPCIPIQALFWVTHVASPLTEDQLRQALAIEYEDFDYNPRRESKDPGGISALCGGWVIVDPRDQKLRVAHKRLAAAHNRENMAAKLLDNGVKVNVAQANGRLLRTPLYDAIFYCNENITDNLLRHSADMTLRQGDKDVSPLDFAYEIGREIIASQLATFISARGSTKAQELQFLVRGGFAGELKQALRKGLNVNLPCENGKLALDYARELGNQTIVDILLAAGAVSNP